MYVGLPTLFMVVNNVVQHRHIWLIQAQQRRRTLNYIVDNYMNCMGSTALLHLVFNNLEQIFDRV
jgi:hypothetical protein